MKKVTEAASFFTRPVVLAPISIALGAGAAICFVGFPKLSSAEAAAWLSAFWTAAAVVVALGLALWDGRRRRADAADQALGVSVLLFTALVDWNNGIRRLAHHVKMQRKMAITESFHKEGGDVLKVPPVLEMHLERLHVLGPASVPLSQAVIGAMYAKRMEYAVREAVRDYQGDNVDVLEAFRIQLVKITDDLEKGIGLIGRNLSVFKK